MTLFAVWIKKQIINQKRKHLQPSLNSYKCAKLLCENFKTIQQIIFKTKKSAIKIATKKGNIAARVLWQIDKRL